MIKLTTWFPGSLVLLSLAAGCGSDSGSNSGSNGQPSTADVVSSCNTTCNKEKSCNPSLASFIDCSKICDPSTFTGGTGTGGSTSTTVTCDYGALKAALDHCATVDCSELTSCEEQATSLCKSTSSGTGGTSGVGAGGTGEGTGGTAEGAGGSATGAGATTGTSSGGSSTGTGTCAPCGGKGGSLLPGVLHEARTADDGVLALHRSELRIAGGEQPDHHRAGLQCSAHGRRGTKHPRVHVTASGRPRGPSLD